MIRRGRFVAESEGFAVFDDEDAVHAVPLFEAEPIHLRRVNCWCLPRVEQYAKALVMHRAHVVNDNLAS